MTNGWKMTFLLGFCLFNIRGEGLAVSFREGITNSMGFSGTPKDMGPPYGKLPILFPYHSHKNP